MISIKLTGLPENEKVFEIFYGYDPIEEFFDSVCVEGYLVNAEEAKQNFDAEYRGAVVGKRQ